MTIRRPIALAMTLTAAVTLASTPRPAAAFSGEDPITGGVDPVTGETLWYHQLITAVAARTARFAPQVVDYLKWQADYIDSYLYNPLWWARGGYDRLKVAIASREQLVKLHFDDLTSTDEVRAAWRRLVTGTLAGLVWAAQRDDTSAALNILGVSLHATQDFYSHSSWVNDPARRSTTWLATPQRQRNAMFLWTGNYELPDHLGIAPHGTISFACSLMRRRAVAAILDLACLPFSPVGNTATCRTWRTCGDATSVRSQILADLPSGVVYYQPAGVALDNTWMAELGVEVRGLHDTEPGLTGRALFATARHLAEQASAQWLAVLDREMTALGYGAFWRRVRTQLPATPREHAYEAFDTLAYQFITAGPYPDATMDTQWFLRVTLDTADERHAGTDANIALIANGRRFSLDYAADAPLIVAHDDFERGDRTVYTVGPFDRMPTSMYLVNDGGSAREVVVALTRAVGDAIGAFVDAAGDVLLSLIAGHADPIDSAKIVWSADTLRWVGARAWPFDLDADGRGEGHYRVRGRIRRTAARGGPGDPAAWVEYRVDLDRLLCIHESQWDRGSSSDEPFFIAALTPAPGDIQPYLSRVYHGVDTGETRTVGHSFTVRVPRSYGAIVLAISVFEHDTEPYRARRALLDRFVTRIEGATARDRADVSETVAAAIAQDLKLSHVNVYAFSRGASVAAGEVYDSDAPHWIEGSRSHRYRWDNRRAPVVVRDASSLERPVWSAPPWSASIPPARPRLPAPVLPRL